MKTIKHAIKKIHRTRWHKILLPGESKFKYKPKQIWLRVFLNNGRLRTLLPIEDINQENLLVRVEWQKQPHKMLPLKVITPDIVDGKLRLQFNKKYVE